MNQNWLPSIFRAQGVTSRTPLYLPRALPLKICALHLHSLPSCAYPPKRVHVSGVANVSKTPKSIKVPIYGDRKFDVRHSQLSYKLQMSAIEPTLTEFAGLSSEVAEIELTHPLLSRHSHIRATAVSKTNVILNLEGASYSTSSTWMVTERRPRAAAMSRSAPPPKSQFDEHRKNASPPPCAAPCIGARRGRDVPIAGLRLRVGTMSGGRPMCADGVRRLLPGGREGRY